MVNRWRTGEGVRDEPFWLNELHAEDARNRQNHSIDWIVHVEDLPEETNFVSLDFSRTDLDGLPGAKIHYTQTVSEHPSLARFRAPAGARRTRGRGGEKGLGHAPQFLIGTQPGDRDNGSRSGDFRRERLRIPFARCRQSLCHRRKPLFPTSTGRPNPTATICALSRRISMHIAATTHGNRRWAHDDLASGRRHGGLGVRRSLQSTGLRGNPDRKMGKATNTSSSPICRGVSTHGLMRSRRSMSSRVRCGGIHSAMRTAASRSISVPSPFWTRTMLPRRERRAGRSISVVDRAQAIWRGLRHRCITPITLAPPPSSRTGSPTPTLSGSLSATRNRSCAHPSAAGRCWAPIRWLSPCRCRTASARSSTWRRPPQARVSSSWRETRKGHSAGMGGGRPRPGDPVGGAGAGWRAFPSGGPKGFGIAFAIDSILAVRAPTSARR